MRRSTSRVSAGSALLAMIALAGIFAVKAGAQDSPPSPVLQRLRAAAQRGDTTATRHLADTVTSNGEALPSEAAEAFFWRGMLAGTRDSARAHLLRVAVEYPLTSVAGDALYRLAQMDLADGDRASAIRRLTRVNRDYGTSTKGADAAFELSQLLFASGNARDGCAALDSALTRLPAEQVERRNRMSYSRRSCAQLESEVTRPDSARADSSVTRARESTGASSSRSAPPARLWSAQAGAFEKRADAEKLAERLKVKGYDARVTGERPFRVRIGHFAKRADASAVVAKLKSENTAAILVEAERR